MKSFWGKSYIASRRKTAWPALCAFAAACVLYSSSAYGAVTVAGWDFSSGSLTADLGAQSGTAVITASGTTSFPGTYGGLNAKPLDESGTSGMTLTLHVSGTGYSSFSLAYDANRASGGVAVSQSWAYSLNGTSGWTTTGITQPATINGYNTVTSYTVDFSGVTAINNQANVYLRDTLTWTGTGSPIGFDNISLTAVPEPINVALAVFGLVFVGGGIGRHYLARKSVSPVA